MWTPGSFVYYRKLRNVYQFPDKPRERNKRMGNNIRKKGSEQLRPTENHWPCSDGAASYTPSNTGSARLFQRDPERGTKSPVLWRGSLARRPISVYIDVRPNQPL